MLVGFIGVPYSGKTTTAAMLFSSLKEGGIVSEFLPEAARLYIAEQRYDNRTSDMDDKVVLLDRDQKEILERQYTSEVVMKTACGDEAVIVTDSNILNTLLYMSNRCAANPGVVSLVKAGINQYDLMFVCGTLPRDQVNDPNRIHTAGQSIALAEKLTYILEEYDLKDRVIFLEGDIASRFKMASRSVLQMRAMG